MDNLWIYNAGREVPETAKTEIRGGRMAGKTDINPVWRIKKLTELFGPCGIGWYYKTIKEWTEAYEKSAACFVDIELFIKVDGEWSKPICGTGGSMFVSLEKSGPFVSDECYKMATTDAISVACKQLGIGADVYYEKDVTKYTGSKGDDFSEAKSAVQPVEQDYEMIEYLKELEKELSRTGYGKKSIEKTYRLEDIRDISKLQIKDCISKLKKLPDKAVGT